MEFALSDSTAIRRFEIITQNNIDRSLAIVLDGNIISAPVIKGKVSDRGVITGHFDTAAAERLAAILNAGILPAPITIKK